MKKYIKIAGLILASSMAATGISALAYASQSNHQNNVAMLPMSDDSVSSNVQYVDSVDKIQLFSSAASNSMFAVIKDSINGDSLYSWGGNSYGQLGLSSATANIYTPTLVAFPETALPLNITYVASDLTSTIVILNDLEVWATGSNANGQFGNGTKSTTRQRTFSLTYTFTSKITSYTHGYSHSAAISGGRLYTWGRNGHGQLGLGDTEDRSAPTVVSALDGKNLGQIKCGVYNTTVPIIANNQITAIYAWGYNTGGQLGVGDLVDKTTPTLELLSGIPGVITDYYLGEETQFYCVYDIAQPANPFRLYTVGSNRFNQNGVEGATNIHTPVTVPNTPTEPIDYIESSFHSTSILTKSGSVYSVGDSDAGSNIVLKTFTLLNLSNVTDLISAWDTTIAISNGHMYAWGGDVSVYGSGTGGTRSSVPVQIDAFANPSALAQSNVDVSGVLDIDAANALYADGTFNSAVFLEYVNVTSFPAETTFTMTTAPEVNTTDGTIGLTVQASDSYTQPNGAKTVVPTDYSITLQGFKQSTPINWALIIGLSVTGGVLLLIIIGLLIWYMRRRGGGSGRTAEWFSDVKAKLNFSNMFTSNRAPKVRGRGSRRY